MQMRYGLVSFQDIEIRRSSIKVDTKILCEIARGAGDLIMEVYNSSDFQKEIKDDNSPVTIADKKADAYIRSELQKIYADIPIISEESEIPPYSERVNWTHCFIVDPLDGTKEFIKRNDEFTVNIALVQNGKSIEGVVYAPAKDLMYFTREGKSYRGDKELPIYNCEDKFRVVTSRNHINDQTLEHIEKLKEKYPHLEEIPVGSSLKLCLIAEGSAEYYPRFGPTSEWDIAAAQAVVEQAGGSVTSADSMGPLIYNKEDILNPHFLCKR